MMSSTNIPKCRCILHVSDKDITDKEVKQFDDGTWEKTKTAYADRQTVSKESKYFNIKLPDEYDDAMGYHRQCYNDFTAIRKISKESTEPLTSKTQVLRSNVEHPSTSSSGVFQKECIFCNSITKSLGKGRRESLGSCETENAEQSIRNAVEILHDELILAKIAGIDMKAKEVKYHHSCRKAYLNKAKIAETNESKVKSQRSSTHEKAFDLLKLHIAENIIENEGAELLTSLHTRYKETLDTEEASYSAQHLCEKIMKEYPDKVRKHKLSNKKGLIIYNSNLSEDTAVQRAFFDEGSVKEAAVHLRSEIKKMQKTQEELPEPLTAEVLID